MARTPVRISFLIGLIMLLLAACQSVSEPTPAPTPDAAAAEAQAEEAAAIRDTTWTVKSFGDEENPIPGVDGTYPSINVLLGRFNGYTGCNYFVGTYTADGDSVRFDPPAVTRGFCEDEALQQQQEAFLTVLVTVNRYAFDGENVHLFADDRQLMTLEPLEPVPFEGTTWNYRFFQGEMPNWQPVIPGTAITAVFEGDTISGSAGCNQYNGTMTRNGDEIAIGELATTRMMCEQETMEQEERYLAALQSAVGIRESARTIELTDAEKPILLFQAD